MPYTIDYLATSRNMPASCCSLPLGIQGQALAAEPQQCPETDSALVSQCHAGWLQKRFFLNAYCVPLESIVFSGFLRSGVLYQNTRSSHLESMRLICWCLTGPYHAFDLGRPSKGSIIPGCTRACLHFLR